MLEQTQFQRVEGHGALSRQTLTRRAESYLREAAVALSLVLLASVAPADLRAVIGRVRELVSRAERDLKKAGY